MLSDDMTNAKVLGWEYGFSMGGLFAIQSEQGEGMVSEREAKVI